MKRTLINGLAIVSVIAGCGGSTTPNNSLPVQSDDISPSTTSDEFTFADPIVPNASGTGLPDGVTTDEEIDCEDAEDLCDSGAYACDDIADYCDIGPDGGELSDDTDWDS